ncbi:hypothetical protein [uncultured Thiodictyon sp.]|uniref:hypothetical protein n=1 Tax=uncultured Thiodictyon sp. TaxID=1846217 RepID=UPI0025F483EB|nr:hypothetical protein [uncultured Thiodictyon sp.]
MRRVGALLLLMVLTVALGAPAACGDELAPAAIAEAMRQARYSDGFAVRMNITLVAPTGQRSLPIKLSIVGQMDAAGGRLVIRGIAPERIRNRFIAAERIGAGPIRAVAYRESAAAGCAQADPLMPVFDSNLVVWDLFAPWWSWPEPRMVGTARVAEDDCVNLRLRTDSTASPIREVVSCVDANRHLPLRTQLFDGRHTLVRTVVVDETMRQESGRIAARKFSITGADQAVSEIEVYSGDEDYHVPAGTFAALDTAAAVWNHANHAIP